MIKLGSRVRDRITGFEGILIAKTEWFYGCIRLGIDAINLKDGKPIDTVWFDEDRVCEIESEKLEEPNSDSAPGGPQRESDQSSYC